MKKLVALPITLLFVALTASSNRSHQSPPAARSADVQDPAREPRFAREPQFVHPQSPLLPSEGRAPSPKVTNGSVFESGTIELTAGATLILPDNAIVEAHDGTRVHFYLTKSVHCAGQPPVALHFEAARHHFGIAQRLTDDAQEIATFGEWSNRGGAASIGLLVLVPEGTRYEAKVGLQGGSSQASTPFDPSDAELEACYWHAGPRPAKGWQEIVTDLYHNRFLAPC